MKKVVLVVSMLCLATLSIAQVQNKKVFTDKNAYAAAYTLTVLEQVADAQAKIMDMDYPQDENDTERIEAILKEVQLIGLSMAAVPNLVTANMLNSFLLKVTFVTRDGTKFHVKDFLAQFAPKSQAAQVQENIQQELKKSPRK